MSDQCSAPPRGATRYRRLAGNTVATVAGRLAAIVLALALSTILFRTLGDKRFGLWSLFAFLVGYSALIDFGLSAAVERQVAYLKARDRTGEISRTIGQALLLILAIACALQFLAISSAYVLDAWLDRPIPLEVLRGLRVFPLSLAAMTGSLVIGSGLSGLQRMVALHAWRTVGMTVGTVTAGALAVAGVQRLDVLLMGYTAGAPLAAAGQWWSLRRELPLSAGRPTGPHSWRWDEPTLRQLVRFGGVLQVATIGPMCGEYAFRLIVGHRFGIEYVGIYDLAARAAFGLRSLASALFAAMVPFGVPLLANTERTQASRLVRLAVKYTALFMLPSSMLLYITSDPIVHGWLGATLGSAQVAATLRPLVILHALVSLTLPMAMIGRSAGVPVPEAVTTWSGVLVGLGVSLLAPHFSGAVVLFAAAPLAAGIALCIWLAGRLGVQFEGRRDLLAVAAVAAVGAAAAIAGERLAGWGGSTPTCAALVGILAGVWASVAAIWGFGLISPRERALLMSLARPVESSSEPPGANG